MKQLFILKSAIILCFLLFFGVIKSYATHNRAGEITYRQLDQLSYEVTVTTYTYSKAIADRDTLTVVWGDGTQDNVARVSEKKLPDDYKKNTYIAIHTFPGAGIYEIVMSDQNRNEGVLNIPESVNVPFTIRTKLQINPLIGHNNTPILLNPPTDKAIKGHLFTYNPLAYDIDGDSISYKIVTCLGEGGGAIVDYRLPSATNSITINEITGDLIWDMPDILGAYNIAILIEEWRDGVKIGDIVRDMQITVVNATNQGPEIFDVKDICVEAGKNINFEVSAIDPDTFIIRDTIYDRKIDTLPTGVVEIEILDTYKILIDTIFDEVTLSAQGGVFILDDNPAKFDVAINKGFVKQSFNWQTNCNHIRKQPYSVIFKAESKAIAEDNNGNPIQNNGKSMEVILVDFEHINIRVIGPAPRNPATKPTNSTIELTWEAPDICDNIISYKIYRREYHSDYEPDSCVTGLPSYAGYTKIDEIDNLSNLTYLDNNDGAGLWQGMLYCYRIVATFTDGSEGYPSEEVCDHLVRGIPLMTNVSVTKTDNQNGLIYIAWSKPVDFDTIAAPGPYKYVLFKGNDLWGERVSLLDSISNINDTVYVDTINTVDGPWSYQVALINNQPGNKFTIGVPQIASEVYLSFTAAGRQLTLNYKPNTPWLNTNYEIYKENKEISGEYNLLVSTLNTTYTDTGLIDGEEYCYYIKSTGSYSIGGIITPIINYSQKSCGSPIDTIPPCLPDLTVNSDCEKEENRLVWTNPNDYCSDDAVKYKIYYKSTLDGEFQLIETINSTRQTFFIHKPEQSLTGCYVVTALDYYDNESSKHPFICVDECYNYNLPNIFTPDGNDNNQLYTPINLDYNYVDNVEFKVFNRWGNLVFETTDIELNWDGINKDTGKLVSDGVYYYVCDVYEYRLTGIEPRNITGFIYVYGKNNTIKN